MSEEIQIIEPVVTPYTAEFTTTILNILTGDYGDLVDVIKKVEFSVRGRLGDQTFELQQWCDLTDPDAVLFKPLEQVTEADVVAWVDTNFNNWSGVKDHIQMILDRQVSMAALEPKPLPWAPAADTLPGV